MFSETKYVAEARGRVGAGLGRKRPLFGLFSLIAENNLVNLL